MKIIPRSILAVSLVVIIAAAGIYIFFLRRPAASKAPVEDAARAASAGAEAPLPVKVFALVRGDLVVRLTSPGEVIANKRAVLKAEVSGALKGVAAAEGRAVRAGDVLARIDDRTYQLRLESAEAERLKRLSEMLVENRFGGPERRVDPGLEERITDFVRGARRVRLRAMPRAG